MQRPTNTVMRMAAASVLALAGPGAMAAPAPEKDFPYGDGVVYRREVAVGSFSGGMQDGPGPQMECFDPPRVMAPSGNWYFIDMSVERRIVKYDAKKGRAYTIAWSGPAGKLGGLAECARFAGGGYGCSMGLSVEPDETYLYIHDTNNKGLRWRMDLEKGVIELAPGAKLTEGAAVSGGGEDRCIYFAHDDGKLKKCLPDGKTVVDLGVTLEPPLRISTFFGGLVVNVKLGRLYAATRDQQAPWGIMWYWDMKTGKATGVAGPRKGDTPDPAFRCSSGPADKVSFWCGGGPGFGPDRGERYLYYAGGDESTCCRIDMEKKYCFKLVKANPKDPNLWTFGEGRQNKDYKFLDPFNWASLPEWGANGEFYMAWALASRVDVFRPVESRKEVGK